MLLSHPAPCTPANVEYTYSCETGITFLSWDETLGRKSFYVHVHSGDHEASCSTNQTDCSLPTLLCGRMYDVKVIGVAEQCNSSVPGVTQIQTGERARIGCRDSHGVCVWTRVKNGSSFCWFALYFTLFETSAFALVLSQLHSILWMQPRHFLIFGEKSFRPWFPFISVYYRAENISFCVSYIIIAW